MLLIFSVIAVALLLALVVAFIVQRPTQTVVIERERPASPMPNFSSAAYTSPPRPTHVLPPPPPVASRSYFYYGTTPYYYYDGYYYNPMGILIDDLILLSALQTVYADPVYHIHDPVVVNEIVVANDPVLVNGTYVLNENAQHIDAPIAIDSNGDVTSASDTISSFSTSYEEVAVSSGTSDFSSSGTDSGQTQVSQFDGDAGSSSYDSGSSSSSWDSGSSSSSYDSGSSSSSWDSGSSSYDSGSSSSFDSGGGGFGGC